MRIPDHSIESAIARSLRDRGWSVTTAPSYRGGIAGIARMDIDGVVLEVPFHLSEVDLLAGYLMEVICKVTNPCDEAVARVCSGVAM